MFANFCDCISNKACFKRGIKGNCCTSSKQKSNSSRCWAWSERTGGGTVENTSEADINLKITLKVQKLLEQAGATVYDLDKKSLRQKKVSDIKNRVKIGNEAEADIFVSIHLNKIPQSEYWGWQTFFKKGNEQSKKLAQSLQSGLNQTIDKENKRESLKIENVYIIEHVEIPTAIVECGFLSNPEEKALLEQEEYQGKLAWGIYVGIMDYFLEPINNN